MRCSFIAWVFISSLFTHSITSAERLFEIHGNILIPKVDQVPSLRVVIDGGNKLTFSKADGSFIFRDVPAGRYVVDILSEQYLFSQYKVDISDEGMIRALEYKYPGAAKSRSVHPLTFQALTQPRYFEEREKFDILQLIRNPSFLTVILPIGLMYLLPKLSEGMMDPEELKKAQEELGTQDPQALLQGMFGGGASQVDDSDDD